MSLFFHLCCSSGWTDESSEHWTSVGFAWCSDGVSAANLQLVCVANIANRVVQVDQQWLVLAVAGCRRSVNKCFICSVQ